MVQLLMSNCGVHGNGQFLAAIPSKLQNPKLRLQTLDRASFPFSAQTPISEIKLLVRAAASAPPLGGDYSERRKTKKVAGIEQDEVEDPTVLADSDSCFCTFNGVQIHHKICDAELSEDSLAPRVDFPMILLHGFGASVYSWFRVMKPLARVTGSKVVAFDRPAFGLTSRVHPSAATKDSRPLNPYSMMFSALATLFFVDFLAADKAILVGHSAGALVAVDAYFEAPERVAALILVAPAILAPFTLKNSVKDDQTANDNQDGGKSDSYSKGNIFSRLGSVLSMLVKYIREAITYAIKGMAGMINSLYQNAISAILRSAIGVILIRMIIDKFGIAAVRSAWYDSNQVSDDVLQGYTKPLRVKGWDRALVEYTVAILADSTSKSNSRRLTEISCPVLIITGDTDRIVPSWNSERLSRVIPGSCFELMKNCGHLPQEEKPQEFVAIVDKFLQRVFGLAEQPYMQPATT